MKRREKYRAHIDSSYWRQVAKAVKDRAGCRCQVCNSPEDLCAHHRTYANLGNEMEHLDDITCLCRKCHELFHGNSKLHRKPRKPRRETKEIPRIPHSLAFFTDALDGG